MLLKHKINHAAKDEKDFENYITSEYLSQFLNYDSFQQCKNDMNMNIENKFIGQISKVEIERKSDMAEQNKLYFSLNQIDLINFDHHDSLNPSLNELYYFDQIIDQESRNNHIFFSFVQEYSNTASILHIVSSKNFDIKKENLINVSFDRVMVIDDKLFDIRNIYNRIQLLQQNDPTLQTASLFNFFSCNDQSFQKALKNIKSIKNLKKFDVHENILIVNKQKQPVLTLISKHKKILEIYLKIALKVCQNSEQLLGKQMIQQIQQRIQDMQKQLN